MQVREKEREEEVAHLQTTAEKWGLVGNHIDGALIRVSTSQHLESLFRDVEARTGGVDSGDVDRLARLRVSHAPARAAIGRVPRDVKGAADERERGQVAERREPRGEPIGAVGACDTIHRAPTVVERGVERRAQGRRWPHAGGEGQLVRAVRG